jgi:hypothetical protein
MESFYRRMRWLVAIILFVSVAACSDNTDLANTVATKDSQVEKVTLDVYKSRTCLCCSKWVAHVKAFGFETNVHHPANLNKLKSDKGVSPRYQSCHTAVSKDGYVFEGHIPADIIQRFLINPPTNAIGLAVPGMPVGSPGMEMGNRHDEYDVFLLNKDGNDVVYEHIGASD